MNGMISVAPLPHSCTPQPYIPATVDKMAAGTELDVVEAPVALESCSSPPQTYPGCYGLPYQDHNYGAPPPLSPTVITPVEIDPVIETAIESATVTIETSNTEPNEAVVDDSITRCICDFTHDDGYMICCDQCSVWQHIDCMGIDRNKIPETYCCELCDPRPYDKERAMAIQAQKKQEMTDGSSSEEEKLLSAYTAISGRTPTSITLKQKHKANTGEKKRKRRDSKAIERTEKRQQKRIKKEKIEKPIDVKANKKTKDGAKKPVNKKLPNVIVDDDNACDSWDAAQRAWTDTYEEAKSNQYSPDIEAVLALNSLNGAHWAEPSLSKQLQVQLCKVAFIQNDKRGLLTTSNVAMYQTIIEFKGSFMQRNQFDVENTFYKVEHPYVLFYNKCDHMDLCIDATKYGNDARFVRRSCTPNAEVRHVVDSGSMSLFICSTKDMQAETEVTIPFDFNYRDCNYCVECACNRANCSVKKFFKKSKTKENDVPVKKKRTKSQETMELEDSPTAGSVTPKTKKVSPLKISIPPSPTINVNGDSNPSTMAVETTTPDAPLTTPAPKTPTGSSTGTHATAPVAETSDTMDPDEKKMTREERKMLAIMRAFEKLEKREERRKEALARLEHKKPNEETDHEEVKEEVEVHEEQEKGEEPVAVTVAPVPEKVKEVTAKKRKTKSNSTPARRRSRMHSGGSSTAYQSTDDESNHASAPVTPTPCDSMNTSQSVKSFRFHKTKKHLMTEWLMEKGFDTPKPLSIRTDLPEEPSDSAEFVKCIPSPHNSWNHLRRDSTQHPQLTVVRQASLDSSMGSAKKRWLRQAISETTSTTDSGNSSPVQNGNISPSMPSPSCSPPPDFVTPLKKRRMARESLTSQDGLLTHLVTPSTPVFNTDQTDGQLKVEKVVPEGKNGLKPYSPVTPLSPSHFGENLFEKFNKGGCTFGDEKLLKLASVESDVSDSILTCFKSEKIEMKPEAPLITVTSCDLKNTGLETIDESDPASISSQHVTGTLVKCEETSESCGQSRVDVKETTSATDSDSGVKSSSTENKNKLLGDAVAQGFESEPVSRLECTDDVLSETKVKDQLLSDCGLSFNSVSFINVTDPIQSGVNDSLLLQVDVAKAVTNETAEELPVASRSINKEMNLGSPCRLQQLPAGVNTSSRLTVATDSMSPEKNSEAPSVTSTIPFGPKGYVSLSERLASLSPAEKQPAMPVQPTSNVDIAVPPNAAVTEHSQADLMPSSSGQTTGSREQEISSPEKHLMSPTQSSSSSAERGQVNMQSASSSDSGLSVNIPTIGPATTDLSPNTSCPTTPVCGTPPIKKKVSLSEYRKRLKDKTSSNNTPIKVSSLASFSVNSPIAPAPTLPSLPLFTRVTPSKDQDADRARKEVEASWQPRENKPLSLMERLKKEFGVDADDEERLEAASGTGVDRNFMQRSCQSPPPPPPPSSTPPPPAKYLLEASTIESATYQSNVTGPASGGKIPSLLSLPAFPHTPYHQGGPQPIPPPPPPSLNSSSYKQLSGQQGQTFSTGSAKIPSLLNGVYNLPGQPPRHAPSQSLGNGQSTVQNGPTQPSRIHYNHALGKQQYYKR